MAKEGREFERPVTWLLGSTLVRHMGWIALYGLYGRRFAGMRWMRAAPPEPVDPEGEGELWFDYFSDTGDGMRATYTVASLLYADVTVGPDGACALGRGDGRVLPRGRFVVLGGDTAYHVANARTLSLLLETPFRWACKDAGCDGDRRPLYALPGNHDYYDFLDGFCARFVHSPAEPKTAPLPGFARRQTASYFALDLPFGWQLLGLDAQSGRVDSTQQAYFKDVITRRGDVVGRIVVTPEPAVAFGRPLPADGDYVRELHALGLPAPFAGDELPADQCRLDLAGDVHHYARYEFDASAGRYASVVSGLGGAFLHPSHTRLGPLAPAALYPAPEVSRREVAARLFSPWSIFLGGSIPLFGALNATILFFAARDPGTDASLARLVGGAVALARGGLPAPWAPSFVKGAGAAGLFSPAAACLVGAAFFVAAATFFLRRVARDGGDAPPWQPVSLLAATAGFAALPFGVDALHKPMGALAESLALLVYLALSAGAVAAAVWYREQLNTASRKAPRGARAHTPPWLANLIGYGMVVGGVAAFIGAHAAFGGAPVALVALRTLLAGVMVVCSAGAVLLAVAVGAAQRSTRARLGFALLGLWHGVLQLTTPLLWLWALRVEGPTARLGGAVVGLGAGLALLHLVARGVAAAPPVGGRRAFLVCLWLLAGFAGLGAPLALLAVASHEPARPPLWQLAPLAALSALMMCVWFGWYLAAALAFDGHNNEAGGASRVEDYKQILRVRLRPGEATVFVLAVDRAAEARDDVRPRLVDEFTVRAKPSA